MKTKKQILIILMIITSFITGIIYSKPSYATNSNVPAPNFTIHSQGAVLIDSNSGKLLYGKNENQKLYPASTTKILTAIIAIENCKPTDKITASYDAVMSLPSGYSNAAIQPGETIEFQDLLDMFLIQSANEIGNIFAEHISGSISDFAKLMNQKAAQLGCTNSHFTNPSGIHDTEHYSTAYDMALIAKYCMKNQTFRNTVSKSSCKIAATDKYEERYFRNTNDLLNSSSKYYYKYAIGTKTGYTSQAKRCLIATSIKDNLELITVVLGADLSIPDKRYEDTINLFEYGYKNYKIEKIATKNTIIEDLIIGNATKDTEKLSLVLKDDLTGIVPSNFNSSTLKGTVKLNDLIAAPIEEGAVLGKITYNIGEFEYSSDLVANHSVEEFNPLTVFGKITLAFFVLFVLSKILLPKKKSKKKLSKNRNSKKKKKRTKKNTNYKKSIDSIYKF